MPEITTITSEALQAEVRRLLPSQRGFGTDLEAQNVIVPIVDLTPTADGSGLREDLQTAASFGNVTANNRTTAGTETLVSTPGFYKYTFVMSVLSSGTAFENRAQIKLDSGSATKNLHDLRNNSDAAPEEPQTLSGGGIVFLDTGEFLQMVVAGNDAFVSMSAWQIADKYGSFVNPSGFTFE
jgi:hypothetical protein